MIGWRVRTIALIVRHYARHPRLLRHIRRLWHIERELWREDREREQGDSA